MNKKFTKSLGCYIESVMDYLNEEYFETMKAVRHENYPMDIANKVGKILWDCFMEDKSHVDCCGMICDLINENKYSWVN